MSALDDLMEKSLLKCTRLESAIIDAWAFGSVRTAQEAAEELAALRRVAESAQKWEAIRVLENSDELFGDQFDQNLAFAVRQYNKCVK